MEAKVKNTSMLPNAWAVLRGAVPLQKLGFSFSSGTLAAELSGFGRPVGHCSLF